jgi:hypothetical protein
VWGTTAVWGTSFGQVESEATTIAIMGDQ